MFIRLGWFLIFLIYDLVDYLFGLKITIVFSYTWDLGLHFDVPIDAFFHKSTYRYKKCASCFGVVI